MPASGSSGQGAPGCPSTDEMPTYLESSIYCYDETMEGARPLIPPSTDVSPTVCDATRPRSGRGVGPERPQPLDNSATDAGAGPSACFAPSSAARRRMPSRSRRVNALLHHLPQWRHIAQPLHVLFGHLDRVPDLPLRGKASDPETNAGVRERFVHAQRPQHVARLQAGRGASAAAAHRDGLERHQQRLALHVREAEIDAARIAVRQRSVQLHVLDAAGDAVVKLLRKGADVLVVAFHLLQRDGAGGAQSHHQRCGQRARAQTAFLSAAAHQRFNAHPRPPPHVQCADAFRAVQLVAADGQQVDVHLLHIDRYLAHRLRGVTVEEHFALAAHAPDLLYRLNGADLVVHHHHRHQRRVVADSLAQPPHVQAAVGVHRQVRDLEPLALQVAARIQHALVLGGGGDDVALGGLVKVRHAFDGHVVGLGRAAGEDDLFGTGSVHQAGDMLARFVGGLLRCPAVLVGAGVRVAKTMQVKGEHSVQHPRVHRRRRLEIHVDGALERRGGGWRVGLRMFVCRRIHRRHLRDAAAAARQRTPPAQQRRGEPTSSPPPRRATRSAYRCLHRCSSGYRQHADPRRLSRRGQSSVWSLGLRRDGRAERAGCGIRPRALVRGIAGWGNREGAGKELKMESEYRSPSSTLHG
eukprot:ctg_428.g299